MSKKLIDKEEGLVAITTTLVIMIIITLLITSFTLIVGREQRQSLDRQLSTQAFYAAESGVQDAINALSQGAITTNITDCNGYEKAITSPPYSLTYNNQVTSTTSDISNISYSCVLINRNPGELKYDVLDPSKGTYLIPIRASDYATGGGVSSMRISWQNTVEAGSTDVFETTNGFPQNAGQSLNTGMPRITIIPGEFSNTTITTDTRTLFLYPNAGTGGDPADFDITDPANTGAIVNGNCNTTSKPDGSPYNCNVDIQMPRRGTYFLAIKPLYKPISLQIDPFDGTTDKFIEGAQAIVDVTGRAEDVLRRIQVRVPYVSPVVPSKLGALLPLAGIETTNSICKQFEVTSALYRDLCTVGTLIDPSDPTTTSGGPGGGPGPNPGGGTFGEGNAVVGGAGGNSSGSGGSGGSGGGVVPAQRDYRWNHRLYNRSTNPRNIVSGCEWDFGDGDIRRDQACYSGEYIDHRYQQYPTPLDVPDSCKSYRVVLTIYFNNGYPPEVSNPYYANIPTGDKGKVECAGQYQPV